MSGGPQDQKNYIGIRVANGEPPLKGPRTLAVNLDFSIKSEYTIKLDQVEALDRLEFVQGAFVDNTLNSAPLTILCRRSQQMVTFPAYSFGYLAMFTPNPADLVFATSTQLVINALLCSFPVANYIQIVGANGAGTASAGGIGADFSANKPAIAANLLVTVPVNAARNSIEVQNQSAETIQVVMDDGAGNNVSIGLLAPGAAAGAQGSSYLSITFKGRLRIFSATANDQVFVRQN